MRPTHARLPPLRVPKAPRLLSGMHRTQLFVVSCLYVLLEFGASDVGTTLKIQTYCTRYIDDLILNELLNLSCKCDAVRDDVASIRIQSCNVALTSNVACTDRSFAPRIGS